MSIALTAQNGPWPTLFASMDLVTDSTFLATTNDCFSELFVKALTRKKQTDLVLNNIQDLVQAETTKDTSLLQ